MEWPASLDLIDDDWLRSGQCLTHWTGKDLRMEVEGLGCGHWMYGRVVAAGMGWSASLDQILALFGWHW